MRLSLSTLLVTATASIALAACSSAESTSTSASTSTAASSSSGSGGSGGSGGAGGAGGAATPSWSQAGLDGDIVRSLTVDRQKPGRILVGPSAGSKDQGFFLSTDAGKTWPMAPGLPVMWCNGLAESPVQEIALANPGVDGLLRSTDGAGTWSPVMSPFGDVAGLAFHPTKANVAYASDNGGVYVSVDSGATFTHPTNMGLPIGMQAIGAVVSDGAKLYLGVGDQGVYVSTDEGASFTPANAGLPMGDIQAVVLSLAANASRPGFVLAQTNGKGFFRTDDAGTTWKPVDLAGDATRYSGLAIDPLVPTTLYVARDDTMGRNAGLLRSTDDGKTWTPFGPDGVDVLVIDFDTSDGTIYVGSIGKGVWRYGL